jgi:hypothetical protein
LTIQIDYSGDGSGYAGGGYNYFYNVPTSSIAADLPPVGSLDLM